MRDKILLILFVFNFFKIHINGLYLGDEAGKVNDKISETGQYLRRLENLESKLAKFFLQDQGFERIGTMNIVNNGHVQVAEVPDSGLGLTNKTYMITSCSPESVLVSMKFLVDSMKDLERRMRHLVENQKTQTTDDSTLKPEQSSDVPVFNDCSEIKSNKSGVYKIKPEKSKKAFDVYCDMATEGGGWTVFQNRFDGSVDFYRGWEEYKNGFGKIDGEYWLGLEKLHELTTSKNNELYIWLEDFDKAEKFARYTSFVIDSENEGYRLKSLGVFSGSAGDSMRIHEGLKFTTLDKKHDSYTTNCAVLYIGAWWYGACHHSNLNGKYLTGAIGPENRAKGMCWYTFRGHDYSLKGAKMMIRPKK